MLLGAIIFFAGLLLSAFFSGTEDWSLSGFTHANCFGCFEWILRSSRLGLAIESTCNFVAHCTGG